jgi:hypothetical protein
MASEETLERNIVTFLRATVSDPMSRSTDWVYVKFPREEVDSPFMCVFDRGVPSSREKGIGNEARLYWKQMDIMIYTNRDTVATINANKKAQGSLIAYLIDQVKNAFRDNLDTLRVTYSITDRIVTNWQSLPFDSNIGQYSGRVSVNLLLEDTVS